MLTRRLARMLVVAAMVAGLTGGLAACGGGAKAGDGQTSPPSTTK